MPLSLLHDDGDRSDSECSFASEPIRKKGFADGKRSWQDIEEASTAAGSAAGSCAGSRRPSASNFFIGEMTAEFFVGDDEDDGLDEDNADLVSMFESSGISQDNSNKSDFDVYNWYGQSSDMPRLESKKNLMLPESSKSAPQKVAANGCNDPPVRWVGRAAKELRELEMLVASKDYVPDRIVQDNSNQVLLRSAKNVNGRAAKELRELEELVASREKMVAHTRSKGLLTKGRLPYPCI